MTKFKNLVAADLLANTGRQGILATVSGIVFHPGFCTLFFYRVAVRLHTIGLRRLALLAWRVNTALSGCHIHLEASISGGLFLPHPTGIVIGMGVAIGECCTIYQNCTVGRGKEPNRYPSIGARTTLYPGSIVVGAIVVGEHSTVGAGSVVIRDVGANSTVAGNPAKVISNPSPTDS